MRKEHTNRATGIFNTYKDLQDHVVRLSKRGVMHKEIAELYGIAPATVSIIMKRYKNEKPNYFNEEETRLRRLLNDLWFSKNKDVHPDIHVI